MALVIGSIVAVTRQTYQEQLDSALITAIKQNDTKNCLALLAEGANANCRENLSGNVFSSFLDRLYRRLSGKKPGQANRPSALHLAAYGVDSDEITHVVENDLAMIQALLDRHADPNSKDEHGDTPLMVAMSRQHWKTATLLLQHGANPNLKQGDGGTVIIMAALRGQPEMITLLLDKGADINFQGSDGSSALMYAAGISIDCVKLLIDRGADVNLRDRYGRTVLGYALETQRPASIIKLLREAGGKE